MGEEPEDSERNPLAVVSLGCGVAALALLIASDWYFRGPPPSYENSVIGIGFVLSLLALGTGAFAIEGQPLYRVAGIALGFVSILGWGFMYFGANL